MKRIGLIINPIAGMGGRVGLKGTDGEEILRKAIELGAKPIAPNRAKAMLEALRLIGYAIELITYPHEMGEDEAKESGFDPMVIGSIVSGKTTAADTKRAAEEMVEFNVDLIVFVGGDGTARDICEIVGTKIPVLGVPAGVKVYSGVFATDPRDAARIISAFVKTGLPLAPRKVMDIDEGEFRKGRLSAKLYGHMLVPFEFGLLQSVKIASQITNEERVNQLLIAKYVVEGMEQDTIYILGPGSTVYSVAEILGIQKSLLGVDLVENRRLIGFDVNETQILSSIKARRAKIIVTPIGGQGFIFGRGNQQISPAVLRAVGKENVIVISTQRKLQNLQKLLIDSGDPVIDEQFKGPIKVITGYREEKTMLVE